MRKKIKKAFTLVELLVVIAILAILATVSIVGYNSFTKKAKVSNDTVLVKQMNDVLFANRQTDDKNNTMTEALEDVFGAGYDVEKLTPTTTNYNIVWDSENDQMVLLDDSKNVVYPTEKVTSKDKMFLITKTAKDFSDTKNEFAHYLTSEFTYDGALAITTGLDVGSNTNVNEISYTSGETGKTVSINTNKDTILNVDASLDTVYHYGDVKKVDIEAVAGNSYHEYGNVLGNIEIKKGRVVVEKGSKVSTILVNSKAANDVKVNVVKGASVGSVAPTTEAAKSDINASSSIPTDSKVEEVVDIAKTSLFAGGLGTEKSPYLISDRSNFSNIKQLSNDMITGKSYYFKQNNDIVIDSESAYSANGFTGVYDGSNYKIIADFPTSNYKSLFNAYQITGHVTFKNMKIVMSNVGVNLLACADWGTSFGAIFDNITFDSTEDIINVNCSNFGFVVIDALFTKGNDDVEYVFSNITNNVNIQNEGTCTGFLIGSGPNFSAKTNIKFINCINNGNITGTSSVGYLYGNSSYIDTISNSNSIIEVTNCTNSGIFNSISDNSKPIVEFAPKLNELNAMYQNAIGGSFLSTNYFADKNVIVNQENDKLSINTSDNSVSYKLAFNVNSTYWTINGSAWTNSDLTDLSNRNVWNVSNGRKYFISLPINTESTSPLSKTFKAYDKRTAEKNGIEVNAYENGFAIVVKNDVTYLVFDVNESTYIDSNVSLLVYAYDSSNSLLGVKKIA